MMASDMVHELPDMSGQGRITPIDPLRPNLDVFNPRYAISRLLAIETPQATIEDLQAIFAFPPGFSLQEDSFDNHLRIPEALQGRPDTDPELQQWFADKRIVNTLLTAACMDIDRRIQSIVISPSPDLHEKVTEEDIDLYMKRGTTTVEAIVAFSVRLIEKGIYEPGDIFPQILEKIKVINPHYTEASQEQLVQNMYNGVLGDGVTTLINFPRSVWEIYQRTIAELRNALGTKVDQLPVEQQEFIAGTLRGDAFQRLLTASVSVLHALALGPLLGLNVYTGVLGLGVNYEEDDIYLNPDKYHLIMTGRPEEPFKVASIDPKFDVSVDMLIRDATANDPEYKGIQVTGCPAVANLIPRVLAKMCQD